MELKLCFFFSSIFKPKLLLIVPYGIETRNDKKGVYALVQLLIVPYGIETAELATWWRLIALLIVPYGIETRCRSGC